MFVVFNPEKERKYCYTSNTYISVHNSEFGSAQNFMTENLDVIYTA
jgi:hypothetical protein